MTEDELRHYFFGDPTHSTFVAESGDRICAFINFYPLETIKEGKIFLYIIIDFLICDNTNEDERTYVAPLLYEAVKIAEQIGAKGIVFENATYLDYQVYSQLGMVPTFRKMNMVYGARNNDVSYVGNFRCDIK
jgi:hypothetical protein